MRTIKVVLCLLLAVGVSSLGFQPREWQFVEKAGTVWVKRGSVVNGADFQDFQADNPPVSGACEKGVPKVEYSQTERFSLGEEREDLMYRLYSRVGKWSVRTLHIWGYDDIEIDDCKFVIGFGTAFIVALVGDKLVWLTVEHNVKTRKYWERTVATQWFVREDNKWHELLLLGCKEGKYCVLISSALPLLPINLFDDDYITNEVRVLERTYLYGCTVVSQRIRFLVHYRLHFFCLGNEGYVISPHSIPFSRGGDLIISNPATGGFSGSPVLVWRDGWKLVGTVNSGVEGVFTAAQFIDEGIIKEIKAWFDEARDIFETKEEDRK